MISFNSSVIGSGVLGLNIMFDFSKLIASADNLQNKSIVLPTYLHQRESALKQKRESSAKNKCVIDGDALVILIPLILPFSSNLIIILIIKDFHDQDKEIR